MCIMSKIHDNLQNGLPERLQAVARRIAAATQAAGRAAGSVGLLAVSKTFEAPAVAEVARCGQGAFGENYVQEGVQKILALRDLGFGQLQWHMIGPLQSNKTRPVAEHFDWVHSVDRIKLAERLSEQRPAHLPALQVCIQVNVDGGPNKAGVAPPEALALARAVQRLPRLQLRGLMCIPEPATEFVEQHALFMRASALFGHIQLAEPGWNRWDTLSMGMSADLEAAIHAGSTMVRVGTAIFGGRRAAGLTSGVEPGA